jgi:hypothetical protein
MLFREAVAVCCKNNMELIINCVGDMQISFDVTKGDTYSKFDL